MEKLQRFIDSTFKSFLFFVFFHPFCFFVNWVEPPVCVYLPDLPTSVKKKKRVHNQRGYCTLLLLPCMVILVWSELHRPPVPKVCVYTQRSPWAAVCLFSRGLVATAMWLWLTVGLTTPFMRHLLAVNQDGHPGAIDGAVSLCEMCLSKPTHSATPSPCLGSLTFVYCPLSTRPFACISFFSLPVCPSPSCFPSETRQPLNPRSNHRFFGYTFVILRPSGFCNGVLHEHFCRWLRPDVHVV